MYIRSSLVGFLALLLLVNLGYCEIEQQILDPNRQILHARAQNDTTYIFGNLDVSENIYGLKLYQGVYQVCDTSGNCGGGGEIDPQVGVLVDGKWCTSNGTAINCESNPPSAGNETDPIWTANKVNYYNITQSDSQYIKWDDESTLDVDSADRADYWDSLDTPADINAGSINDDGTYILTANEGNLNVNSSDYWDGLDNLTDINSGDITDDNTYVTVSGDSMTGNLNMTNNNITNISNLIFDGGEPISWNPDYYTLNIPTGLGNTIQVGQELTNPAKNGDSVTLYNGQVVSLVGSTGDRGYVIRADASNINISSRLAIVTIDSCNVNTDCPVTTYGRVNEINTSAWSENSTLYLSADGSGNLTDIAPEFPNFRVLVGYVIRSHETQGAIFVQPQLDYTDGVVLNELYVLTNGTFEQNINAIKFYQNGTAVIDESDTTNWDKNNSDDFSGSWNDLTDIPAGFSDNIDNDTQLTESQVDDYVSNNGYLTDYTETDPFWSGNASLVVFESDTTNWDKNNSDDFSGSWNDLTDIPAGFSDNIDNDTQYTAGSNLTLSSFEFSVNTTSLKDYFDMIYSTFSGSYNDLSDIPANIDEDSTDDLTTSTDFGGDVSGTYSALSVEDNSHLHSAENISAGTFNGNYSVNGNLDVNGTIQGKKLILIPTGVYNSTNIFLAPNGTSVDGSFSFLAGGADSLSNNDGPYFYARGNDYSPIAGQRGQMGFVAGSPANATGLEGALMFLTNGTYRLTIPNSGNVGIGTTSPSQKLDVAGNVRADKYILSDLTSSYIVGGLGDVGINSNICTFYLDGDLYAIAGNTAGDFDGFKLNSNSWQTNYIWESNSGITSGLSSTSGDSDVEVFWYEDMLYAIIGNVDGTYQGYNWTGAAWQADSNIISGLGDAGYSSTTTVYQRDGTLYLISGEMFGNVGGFSYSGSTWTYSAGITSGLTDVGDNSNPDAFWMDGTLYIIIGESDGTYTNTFYWTGSAWASEEIITYYEDVGSVSSPEIFIYEGNYYLIVGENSGIFNGYRLY